MSAAGGRTGLDEAPLSRLAEEALALCRAKDIHLVTAESCTGGLLAHLLTEVPGASAVFQGGWVVYADALKERDLGVPRALIETNGAVSAEVAEALAAGARKRGATTFAIATTGIAGPTGATATKPAGTVWLALATPGSVQVERLVHEAGTRSENKRAFARRALELVCAAASTYGEGEGEEEGSVDAGRGA